MEFSILPYVLQHSINTELCRLIFVIYLSMYYLHYSHYWLLIATMTIMIHVCNHQNKYYIFTNPFIKRSSSYDTNRLNQSMPTLGSRSLGLSNSTSPVPSGITSSNGYRSRETGVIEKLLLSYGFIRCADREGRLFFHYSQFHGEAPSLHINGEIRYRWKNFPPLCRIPIHHAE